MWSCHVSAKMTTRIRSGVVASPTIGRSLTRTPDRTACGLLVARLIVRVDLRRLDVRVAHPLLERSHRDASRGHARAERVAQLVEGDWCDLGALDSLLKAADELRSVERLAGVRMGEHEIAIDCLYSVGSRSSRQRAGDTIRHRHRPAEPTDFGSANSPRT